VTEKQAKTTERLILEEDFNGDLDAYARSRAGPAPKGVDRDPAHPWHHRKRSAELLVDMPEDHRAPPHLSPLFTRAEICEMLQVSDSGFGKWEVPPVRKSGRYALYSITDVLAYRAVAHYISGHRKAAGGKGPEESKDQIAAAIKANLQHLHGHPGPYYFPPDEA